MIEDKRAILAKGLKERLSDKRKVVALPTRSISHPAVNRKDMTVLVASGRKLAHMPIIQSESNQGKESYLEKTPFFQKHKEVLLDILCLNLSKIDPEDGACPKHLRSEFKYLVEALDWINGSEYGPITRLDSFSITANMQRAFFRWASEPVKGIAGVENPRQSQKYRAAFGPLRRIGWAIVPDRINYWGKYDNSLLEQPLPESGYKSKDERQKNLARIRKELKQATTEVFSEIEWRHEVFKGHDSNPRLAHSNSQVKAILERYGTDGERRLIEEGAPTLTKKVYRDAGTPQNLMEKNLPKDRQTKADLLFTSYALETTPEYLKYLDILKNKNGTTTRRIKPPKGALISWREPMYVSNPEITTIVRYFISLSGWNIDTVLAINVDFENQC